MSDAFLSTYPDISSNSNIELVSDTTIYYNPTSPQYLNTTFILKCGTVTNVDTRNLFIIYDTPLDEANGLSIWSNNEYIVQDAASGYTDWYFCIHIKLLSTTSFQFGVSTSKDASLPWKDENTFGGVGFSSTNFRIVQIK